MYIFTNRQHKKLPPDDLANGSLLFILTFVVLSSPPLSLSVSFFFLLLVFSKGDIALCLRDYVFYGRDGGGGGAASSGWHINRVRLSGRIGKKSPFVSIEMASYGYYASKATIPIVLLTANLVVCSEPIFYRYFFFIVGDLPSWTVVLF